MYNRNDVSPHHILFVVYYQPDSTHTCLQFVTISMKVFCSFFIVHMLTVEQYI